MIRFRCRSAAFAPLALSLLSGCGSPPSPSPDELAQLLDSALVIYDSGAWAEARPLLLEVNAQAATAHDTTTQATALTWLGLAAHNLAEYDLAVQWGEEALRLELEARLDTLIPRTYNQLGLTAWYEGRLADATQLFTETGRASERVGNERYRGAALGNMGLVQMDLGDFRGARASFQTHIEVAQDVGDTVGHANALTNLGMADVRRGRPSAGIQILEEALRRHRSLGTQDGEQNTLAQISSAYAAMGDLGRAHAYYDSAQAVVRALGWTAEEAVNLRVLAELYASIGDTRRALTLYAEAHALNEELGFELEAGADLRALANLKGQLGEWNAAIADATEALGMHRRVGASNEVFGDLLALAELEQERGHAVEAEAWLQEAAGVAQELDLGHVTLDLFLARARQAEAASQPANVLAIVEEVRPILSLGGFTAEIEASTLEARAHLELGHVSTAVELGRAAATMIERAQGTLASGILQAAFSAARLETHGILVEAYLEAGRVPEALEAADAARARSLGGSDHSGSAVRSEAEDLLRQIDGLVAQLRVGYNQVPTAQSELQRTLKEVRGRYEALLISTAEAAGGVRRAPGAWPVATSAEIQGALQPGEALVAYFQTEEALTVFWVTPDSIQVHTVPVTRKSLAGRVRLLRGLLANPASSIPDALLTSLHDIAIGPFGAGGAMQGVERLIIVPHGALTYLPFDALKDRQTGEYLVERFTSVRLPSASALPELRAAGRAGRSSAMERGTAAFAPFVEDLPGSGAEVRLVGETLDRVEVLEGSRATEGRVREALQSEGIVHLATHGILNASQPMFSRIELARGRNRIAEDDGRLEVHELLELEINASLVFLSGCDTGTGAAWSTGFDQGEDFTTLAQSFLTRGASNVVATLWPVADQSAAELATEFYVALAAGDGGVGPSTALAEAQRALLSSPGLSHPFHWAGYVVNGAG